MERVSFSTPYTAMDGERGREEQDNMWGGGEKGQIGTQSKKEGERNEKGEYRGRGRDIKAVSRREGRLKREKDESTRQRFLVGSRRRNHQRDP